MEIENLSIGLAFMAGLVSFISPCVLPLVPAYIGYMGGRATTEADSAARRKFGTFLHGVFFVLGFTIFFVGFGLLTAAASSFLETIGIDIPTLLTRLGGVAVIFFGLYVMKTLDPIFNYTLNKTEKWEKEQNTIAPLLWTLAFIALMLGYFYWAFGADGLQSFVWAIVLLLILAALFRKALNEATSLANFWNRAILTLQIALISDTRQQITMQPQGSRGYLGSIGIGLVFAAGWTPCIGPVYGAVLALANDAAADGGTLFRAGRLLTAYSMGLGIPFLLTALAFNQSVSFMTRLKRHMATIERVSGVLLLLIGILILTGGLASLSASISADGQLADFSYRLEECTAGVFSSRIGAGSYPGCVSDGFPKLTDRFIAAIQKDATSEPATPYIFTSPDDLEEVEVGLEVGQRAPDFTLRTLEGDEISLSDLRGQAVLVNFWATWCGPCRAEMPEFQQVYLAQKERGFAVVAVDYMEDAEKVREFADELGLTFTFVLDNDGDVADLYRINSYPSSFIIDGNGIITFFNRGPTSARTLLDQLAEFEPESTTTAYQID